MRKLTVGTFVTVEGVMQAPGGPTGDPVAAKLNSVPKYVASRTLDAVTWNNSTLIQGTSPTRSEG